MIRKFWKLAAAALTLGLAQGSALAQQYGPPSSGSSSAILFVPATLNLVSGLNHAGYAGDGGLANSSTTQLNYPVGMAYDSSGNLFFADGQNHVVRRIDHATGDISTFAGQEANPGFSDGGGVALDAQFTSLSGLVIDTSNIIYVADRSNDVVWKITPAGAISIYAGGGSGTCSGALDSIGDGCPATSAKINNAWALGIDSSNNIYIADSYNDLVREVNHSTNIITTFAGDIADAGGFGDCSPQGLYSTSAPPYTATEAHLCFPDGIAFDAKGNAYIADAKNNIIRVVNSSGIISTFAGGGADSASTNGVPATDASMSYPAGLYVDPAGRVYISDELGQIIRVVDSSGNINTVLGNTSGELTSSASIGEPDTEPIFVSGQYTGAGDGIDAFAMDIHGNIVATDSSGEVITSAGATGQYVFPEQQVYTTSSPAYITVLNPSGVTLTFSGTPAVTGPFALATGAGAGTCNLSSSGSVAPGASCTIGVTFTPTADQAYTGNVVFDSNANSSPSTINLSGTGIGTPTYSATLTSSLTFSSPATVTSGQMTATLTNTGEGPLTVAAANPAFVGTDPSDFALASTDCPSTLDGGAACHFYVTFTPPGAVNPYTAQLEVTAAPYGNLYASLSGTGTAALTAAATPVIAPAASATYNAPIAVQITDSTPSPTIYYTTDGTAPNTTTSATYSAPFTVSQTGSKVQAIADSSANSVSATASATYTIQPYLAFTPALVGIASGSAQQLIATFSLVGSSTPTASLHYGLDYTVGSVTCTSGGTIEVCTVPVKFVPTVPGQRKDALLLTSGNATLATVYLGGIGQAPLALVEPGLVTNPAPGGFAANPYLYDSTVDENGTVYALTGGDNAVFSVTKAGVVTKLPITGIVGPSGIAIDGAGVLYIAQNTYSKVLITYNTVTGVQGTLGIVPPAPYVPCSSFEYLLSVAADDVGNIFTLDIECGQVFELKADGSYVTTAIDPVMTQPGYIAIDSADDIFVGGYAINEIPVTGTQTQPNTAGGTEGLGVDAAGTLYVGRYSTGEGVYQVAEPAYTTSFFQLDPSAPALGLGLASDGTLYVGNYYNLDKVDRSQGAIVFGEQTTDVTSAPQDVAIYNGGNKPLTLSNIVLTGASSGFAIQAAASNNCTNNLVIAPGAYCQVAATLTAPHAGTFSGTITFTTNSLNTAASTATVALSGFVYGVYVTALPNPLNFGNQTTGTTSAAQTVTLTNNGDLYSAGIGAPSVNSAYTVSLGTCTSGIAPGASCALSVTFDPSLAQAYDDTVTISASSNGGGPNQTVTFGVNGTGVAAVSPQAINFTQPASPVTYASSLTIPLVATGGGSGNPVVFTIDAGSTGTGSISGSTLTVTGVGSIVIDANQAGNASYTAAPQVQRTVVVNKASQTINFTQPTSPVTYSSGLTITLAATGGASGNAVVFTIDASSTATGSISGTTLKVTSTGNIVIDANQAGNANYSAAPQVQRTVAVGLAPQTINFTQPTTPVTFAPSLTITLTATGGASGNPVVFSVDASSSGTGSISGSTLTVTAAGSFVIDANQAGNSTYSAAPQVQRTLVINKAPQTINFTQPTTPVIYSTGLTISLAATGGASGNAVVFSIDTSSTATGSISGSTLTVSSTGNLVIDANQAGNANYAAAPQAQKTIAVNAQSPQTINFTQPTTPITYASSLTISLVATGGASGIPVVFTIDSTSTATGSISGSTLTATSVGSIVIDANQAGNASYTAAPQVQRTVVINQAPQAINFTQPTTPVTYAAGLTITLTATGGASGNAVVFTIDSTSTATGSISGSTATVTSAGNLVIDANQAGNADYSAAPQVQRTVVVSAPPGDFTIGATPASQSVAMGAAATYSVTVGSVNGFGNNVTLSATGLPPGATATFVPPQVNPGDGPATSTLTLQTGTTSAAKSQTSFWPLASPVMALFFLLPFRRWRREWKGKFLLLVAGLASLAAAASLTACGGGFSLPQTSQTYTLTITGTSGTDTHSTTVLLTVN